MTEPSVFACFAAAAARFPDRPLMCVLPETAAAYGIAAGEISYGDALSHVRALAGRYRTAGFGAGHRVGLLLQNRPDYLWHWFALNGLGASVVPINPDLRAGELEYLVAHSEMVLAVAIPERAGDLRQAAAAAGIALAVIAPEEPPPAAKASRSFETAASQPPQDEAVPGISRTTECALLYTSGTTGTPKGCVLGNDYFLGSGEWYVGIGGLGAVAVDPPERMLTPLPLFHMNAMANSVMATIMAGGCIAILDRFHPRTWWDSVRAHRATIIHYLGVMPAMLMAAPALPDDGATSVKFGFGAGVDRLLHGPFEQRFGFPLLEAWAMTETGAGAAVIAAREPRKIGTNCFGRPRPEVEVSIRTGDGSEAAADEPGELLVRRAGADPRAGFFREYLKDPEVTAAAWEGGWFHTGDVVARDADGDLHFIDRKKNVIRRSGENIAAVEVENVLGRHPRVAQVAVAATPDPLRGDEVAALIVPRDPPADDAAARRLAEDIVRFCLERLAYYKAPGFVAFVEAIPLTSTAKIQRGALKAAVAEAIEAGRAIDTCALKKRTA